MDFDPRIITFFAVPLSYFIVIFSILLIQYGMVNIISGRLMNIYSKHKLLVNVMNWWGVFVHEFSHAATAIVTLNRVKEFKVTSKGGHVIHEMRGRMGLLQWLSAQSISLSPAFVPPLIAAVLMQYLGYIDFSRVSFNAGDPGSIIYGLYNDLLPYILRTSAWLLVSLDYTMARNILLLVFITFSFSSAKPSSISGKAQQGDIQSVIEMSLKFPIYTVLFLLLSIIFFWILFKFNPMIFSIVITYLMLLPLLSIFGLMLNYLFLWLVDQFDECSVLQKIIALVVSIAAYAAVGMFAGEQYLINIAGVATLAVALRLRL